MINKNKLLSNLILSKQKNAFILRTNIIFSKKKQMAQYC
ncbi:hypothetical protein A1OE_188 [Candidatus Endolissoclinum faulkneri L2]|uniref:Uncharacterized protein n=1 Tax=Candidatus Endolissoclinum faulkneri L2 TaxID=1193729 RepID=K7YFM9_9PROT|nr:hypothetical protein A1OE_188 [Candidatus Endolissoclinum faulkneri L2]